jgi:ribonuclease P protein component
LPGDEARDARGSAPRLRRGREVARVLRSGTRLRSERVIVFLAPGAGPARAAWVAGRKVGGAVDRNRARRLLREAWWALGPMVREGHDVVFVARRRLADVKAHELIEELAGVLQSAGVLGS